ncbi:hypothetical protein GR255_26615, partial [Mycobacterium tuberculosis]|nr:hypothetical protein [Mycobacterium tuberculosis]
HVEIVMSPKGMYDYFIHAENPDKTLYNIDEIESHQIIILKSLKTFMSLLSCLRGTIRMLIKKLENLKKHTNTGSYFSNHLKAILRYQRY